MQHKVFYCAKSNKQSTKVICRFDRLRTAHSKRQRGHMIITKLIAATHAFDYIVLRVKLGLTSCEGTTALYMITMSSVKVQNFL